MKHEGILRITVSGAKDIRKAQKVGYQDPYFICEVGAQKYKSDIHTDGHCNPVWNITFSFEITNETSATFTVMNSNLLFADDVLGKTTIDLNQVFDGQADLIDAKLVKPSGKMKGTLNILFSFKQKPLILPKEEPAPQSPIVAVDIGEIEKKSPKRESSPPISGYNLIEPLPQQWPPTRGTSIW